MSIKQVNLDAMNKDYLKWTIYSWLFIVPLIPFLVAGNFFFPFITTKAFVWRVIIEIIFSAWILLALLSEEYRPKKSVILYSIAAFLVVIGLADLFGAAPLKSFWSNFERMEGYVTLLHLSMFFVVVSSVFREVDWKRWWNTSLVASFLMVLYCVFQLIGINEIHQGGVRLDGTLGNAIYLAVYMLFHIFIATLLMWREWHKVSLRWVYGILILLQTTILYYTATRGAILGLLGGLFIMALLNVFNLDQKEKLVRKLSIGVLAFLVILVGVFFVARNTNFVTSSPVLSRFSSLNFNEIKTQGRYFVWPMAIEGVKEHPILGWGQENFNYIFNEHYTPEMYKLEPWFDRAHNIFLDWLVVGGILGLVAYLSLYATLLYVIWKKDTGFSHAEKSILTGLIAAYFFHNVFVFDHLISYILFFSLLSYVNFRIPAHKSKEKQRASDLDKVFPLAAGLVSIALIFTLYFVNIKPYQTNVNLIKALIATQSGATGENSPLSFYKKAYASSALGRSEVVEQISSNTPTILSNKSMSLEEKNEFFNFARDAVLGQAEDYSDDARYQLIAGAFLSSTGFAEQALVYLIRARDLMPGKQHIYLEMANAYLNNGNQQEAINTLRHVSEISPDHKAQMDEYIRQIQAGN